MMGRQDDDQDHLFYQFNLDELVPEDHLLRYVDRVLDLKGLRSHLAPFYSHTGRPSIPRCFSPSFRAFHLRCDLPGESDLDRVCPSRSGNPGQAPLSTNARRDLRTYSCQ